MKIKTSELTDVALDWAVAKCENFRDGCSIIRVWNNNVTKIIPGDHETNEVYTSYSPSTNWSQGGPIIEREKIRLVFRDLGSASYWCAEAHEAYQGSLYIDGKGPTPLIAAMRCYVASKLGNEADVPKN